MKNQMIAKYGMEKCREAFVEMRIHGEGAYMAAINTGLPRQAVASCAAAYEEVMPEMRFAVHAIDNAEMTSYRSTPEVESRSYTLARTGLDHAHLYQYGLVLVDRVKGTVDWGDRVTKIGGAA